MRFFVLEMVIWLQVMHRFLEEIKEVNDGSLKDIATNWKLQLHTNIRTHFNTYNLKLENAMPSTNFYLFFLVFF